MTTPPYVSTTKFYVSPGRCVDIKDSLGLCINSDLTSAYAYVNVSHFNNLISLSLTGLSISITDQTFNFNSYTLQNLKDPSGDQDAATKNYVNSTIASSLSLYYNKNYIDDALNSKMNTYGGTFSGDVNFQGNVTISDASTPICIKTEQITYDSSNNPVIKAYPIFNGTGKSQMGFVFLRFYNFSCAANTNVDTGITSFQYNPILIPDNSTTGSAIQSVNGRYLVMNACTNFSGAVFLIGN